MIYTLQNYTEYLAEEHGQNQIFSVAQAEIPPRFNHFPGEAEFLESRPLQSKLHHHLWWNYVMASADFSVQ